MDRLPGNAPSGIEPSTGLLQFRISSAAPGGIFLVTEIEEIHACRGPARRDHFFEDIFNDQGFLRFNVLVAALTAHIAGRMALDT